MEPSSLPHSQNSDFSAQTLHELAKVTKKQLSFKDIIAIAAHFPIQDKGCESLSQHTIKELTMHPSIKWARDNMSFPRDPTTGEFKEWTAIIPVKEQVKEFNDFIHHYFSEHTLSSAGQRQPSLKMISESEINAIRLFSSDECMFFYIPLETDKDRASEYLISTGNKYFGNLCAKDLEAKSLLCCTILCSALRKLPSHTGRVYRGLPLKKNKIADWYSENQFTFDRFPQCFSTQKAVAISFALGIAQSSPLKPDEIPTLLVLNSVSGKKIEEYSQTKKEQEVLYPPGIAFRSLGFDFKEAHGIEFAIVYLSEIKIIQEQQEPE